MFQFMTEVSFVCCFVFICLEAEHHLQLGMQGGRLGRKWRFSGVCFYPYKAIEGVVSGYAHVGLSSTSGAGCELRVTLNFHQVLKAIKQMLAISEEQ